MTGTSCLRPIVFAAAVLAVSAELARADGHIDPDTLIVTAHGTFNRVPYARYDAMFTGVSSARRPYRVPCELIAPVRPEDGRGLVLFDWPNRTTVFVIGQDFPAGRYILTDDFLFGGGNGFATVRCDPVAIGTPWSDGRLDTTTEFILSPGDEYDIAIDFVKALRNDPVAVRCLGSIQRMAAIGYSASGWRLRGLLRLPAGKGLFDFSLVGGCGSGYDFPTGNQVQHFKAERPPLPGAGLEVAFCTEVEVIHPAFKAARARYDAPNHRAYEFAGGSHLRQMDLLAFGGFPDPEKANPADWFPLVRALFAVGNDWCDGIDPPPSIWLGKPRDPTIARDANGNALVRYVGGKPADTDGYRLPEVSVGQNRYVAYDPSYDDGTVIGLLRSIMGGFVDLTAQFISHSDYVGKIADSARRLVAQGYLLEADADAIIERAEESDIGKKP